jgi:hypothetical protein
MNKYGYRGLHDDMVKEVSKVGREANLSSSYQT